MTKRETKYHWWKKIVKAGNKWPHGLVGAINHLDQLPPASKGKGTWEDIEQALIELQPSPDYWKKGMKIIDTFIT